MAAQDLLALFDSFWFEHPILSRKSPPPPPDPSPVTRKPSLHVRSRSEELTLLPSECLSSPSSVLQATPKLQTILSGKEIEDFFTTQVEEIEVPTIIKEERATQTQTQTQSKGKKGKKKGRRSGSKSLSELEFEELKGFMDLGFVFSEEDRDSRLVSIIPGLQRLGRSGGEEKQCPDNDEQKEEKSDEEEDGNHGSAASAISRPYLSEAWDVMYSRPEAQKTNPVKNWRIPSMGNEIDMKDHLRLWAHTVASAVVR